MKNDTFETLVPGLKCSGPKLFRAEVFLGRRRDQAKVFPGSEPKCALGQNMFQAEVSVDQSCLLAKLGVSPIISRT
jgi:hypothetical protein